MTDSPAIVLNNVSKNFRDVDAVRDLSFEVRKGSTFGLLGPNGAGKTTSIRMIVNILAPDTGDIRVLGERASARLKRRIGYLPEERGLYKEMKVGELLLFFATIKGMEPPDAKRRIDDWLAKLQLSDWKNKKASELSKGMAQKIQFILAVLHEPELLILDEPFSGFDPVNVRLLKNIVGDLKQRGTTIVFSTHQMEQVEQLCDDICLLNKGKRVLGGNLREIKRNFGPRAVKLDYQGPDGFLDSPMVKNVTRFSTCVEVRLNDGADGQELLHSALAAGARINRFELVDTSLDDIFVSTVENS